MDFYYSWLILMVLQIVVFIRTSSKFEADMEGWIHVKLTNLPKMAFRLRRKILVRCHYARVENMVKIIIICE